MKLKFKKINEEAIIPSYAHKGDAGVDLYSCEEDYILIKGEIKLFRTGLKIEIPHGYEMQVRPKSGLSLKGITVANTPGTIDCGYRGEIGVILKNYGKTGMEIKKGQKIAQGVFNKIEYAEFEEVGELSDSLRGEGGFGSTGL